MVGQFALKNLSRAFDEEYNIPFDVNFRVVRTNVSYDGDAAMIPCHKLALALSSPVLAKLFFSGKENGAPSLEYDENVVTLKDVDPEVIRSIVKFCYNKKLELSSKSLVFHVELYLTAAILEIEDLQVIIEKYCNRNEPQMLFYRRSS